MRRVQMICAECLHYTISHNGPIVNHICRLNKYKSDLRQIEPEKDGLFPYKEITCTFFKQGPKLYSAQLENLPNNL